MGSAVRPHVSIVVLARLDGTLFDRSATAPDTIAEAVGFCTRSRIPLIFFSNRTRAQLELVQQQLGLRHPFVAENGGALYFPRGYFGDTPEGTRLVAGYESITFGAAYSTVVDRLHETARRLGLSVVGFNDMSVRMVADECGLSLLEARLAKLREHDEPFRILDAGPNDHERMRKGLRAAGLRAVDGASHLHAGADVDYPRLFNVLRAMYQRLAGAPVVTIAIGDALKDLPMLRCADMPLLTHSDEPARADALLEITHAIRRRVSRSLVPQECGS